MVVLLVLEMPVNVLLVKTDLITWKADKLVRKIVLKDILLMMKLTLVNNVQVDVQNVKV